MTNDIEAAARAVIEAWDRPLLGAYAETMHEAVSHLRSALAHAARGEGGPPPWHAPCVLCGHRQSAHNTDTGPCSKCGCDCAAFRPTPPPATGEECRWYTGNGEEYEILPPEEVRRRRIEAARRLRDVGPATGEAKCGWCGGQGYVEGSVNLRPYRIECVRCHPVATGPEIPMGGPVRIIDATPRAGASEGGRG